MNCFYPPLTSLGSETSSIKTVKEKKILKERKISRINEVWGQLEAVRSRTSCDSDGAERWTPSREITKNIWDRTILGKRFGPASSPLHRTVDSVISKDNGTASYISSRYSDETYPIGFITGTSEEESSGYTSVWTVKTIEAEKESSFSWLKNSANHQTYNGKQSDNNFHSDHDVSSPTSSVGAVKISTKDKFDYIRKNRHKFARPALDPPSDKSAMTSRSITASDAGSILFKSFHRRKSELAKQIIKRRQMTPVVSQDGYEP